MNKNSFRKFLPGHCPKAKAYSTKTSKTFRVVELDIHIQTKATIIYSVNQELKLQNYVGSY